MLSEIHKLLWRQKSKLPPDGKKALAQTTQCLKGTAVALQQEGHWVGAWEYTYLPAIGESELGIDMNERASVGRYLREKAAIEKILDEQRGASASSGTARGSGKQ